MSEQKQEGIKLKKLENIHDAYHTMRIQAFIAVIVSLSLVGLMAIYMQYSMSSMKDEIYIKNKGGVIEKATKNIITDKDRLEEYKHHVTMFCENVMQYDQSTYEKNILTASELCDINSFKDLKRRYDSEQRLIKMRTLNVIYTIKIDSIGVNLDHAQCIIKARQIRRIGDNLIEVTQNATFQMSDLASRDYLKNPHGCIIENFKIVDERLLFKGTIQERNGIQ